MKRILIIILVLSAIFSAQAQKKADRFQQLHDEISFQDLLIDSLSARLDRVEKRIDSLCKPWQPMPDSLLYRGFFSFSTPNRLADSVEKKLAPPRNRSNTVPDSIEWGYVYTGSGVSLYAGEKSMVVDTDIVSRRERIRAGYRWSHQVDIGEITHQEWQRRWDSANTFPHYIPAACGAPEIDSLKKVIQQLTSDNLLLEYKLSEEKRGIDPGFDQGIDTAVHIFRVPSTRK